MVKFSAGTRRRAQSQGLDPADVSLVLGRLESAVPHLIFDPWRAANHKGEDESHGEVLWKPKGFVQIALNLQDSFSLRTRCRRRTGPVSHGDYNFLLCLSGEAAQLLSSGLGVTMSLLDFGTYAVAEEVARIGGCEEGVLPAMRFVRSLTQETYENQNLTFGLIFSNAYAGDDPIADGFNNKRLKRLTDGFSTAIVVDGVGNISGYVALAIPEEEGLRLSRRPWWTSGLAIQSNEMDGVGVALARSGDIVVLKGGQLLFSQRAGKWQIWNHAAILSQLRGVWEARGPRAALNRLLTYLYHVALDLAFRRSGGLLVVLGKRSALKTLLVSQTDSVHSANRGSPEKTLDELFHGRPVISLDRRIVSDIASLDGALILDRQGKVLAYGAMTKAAGGAKQGARTRAAARASRFGLAIKVSSDGQISIFSKGRSVLDL